jgi:hypothetical protein
MITNVTTCVGRFNGKSQDKADEDKTLPFSNDYSEDDSKKCSKIDRRSWVILWCNPKHCSRPERKQADVP